GPKPDWMANAPAALGKQLASWKTAAKKAGLAHRFDEIAVLARPAIDLALKKAKPADLKKVVSRLGGDPDLPAGFAWPVVDGVALTFVAQIVIADMKVHDLDARLPAAGLLAVFAQLDATAAAYGEVCRVVLFPFDATLVRTASPPGVKRPIRSAGTFAPKLRLTLPPSEGPAIDGLGLNADERAAYHDDLFLGAIPEGRLHRLLGWPSAATHHGIAGHAFLLQIDSEDRIDFEMGDAEQLRIFVDGPAGARPLDANALAGAVCTLSEA
ncbi:MAG TPA: DUF1963 domain-containing protein, partial [Minicystis sp.]|nr:DUF1963 domain-containing protein [Minicystis sp.]